MVKNTKVQTFLWTSHFCKLICKLLLNLAHQNSLFSGIQLTTPQTSLIGMKDTNICKFRLLPVQQKKINILLWRHCADDICLEILAAILSWITECGHNKMNDVWDSVIMGLESGITRWIVTTKYCIHNRVCRLSL